MTQPQGLLWIASVGMLMASACTDIVNIPEQKNSVDQPPVPILIDLAAGTPYDGACRFKKFGESLTGTGATGPTCDASLCLTAPLTMLASTSSTTRSTYGCNFQVNLPAPVVILDQKPVLSIIEDHSLYARTTMDPGAPFSGSMVDNVQFAATYDDGKTLPVSIFGANSTSSMAMSPPVVKQAHSFVFPKNGTVTAIKISYTGDYSSNSSAMVTYEPKLPAFNIYDLKFSY